MRDIYLDSPRTTTDCQPCILHIANCVLYFSLTSSGCDALRSSVSNVQVADVEDVEVEVLFAHMLGNP